MKKTYCIALLSLLMFSGLAQSSGRSLLVSLGTGGVTGVYYPTGGAICRLINQVRQQHGIRCAVRSTPGSVANINDVQRGALVLGLAESGWLYQAWTGTGHFASLGKRPKLRTLFKLFPEYLTVLARPDVGILRFEDIQGKRISIGRPGTSQRSTMNALMLSNQWSAEDFAQTLELAPAEQAGALCDKQIDVMIYTVGLPSGATKEAARDCGGQLIAVAPENASRLTLENPHYMPMIIRAGEYPDNRRDTPTVGVNATFFTSHDLPDDVAYEIVRVVFENLTSFRLLHPAFAELKPEQMVKGPYPAPLHPGAARYFREAGLLP